MDSNKVLIVSAHYNEDLSWLINQSNYPYVIYSKGSDKYHKYLPINRGAEAESYLHYIVDNYDNLPTHCIFVHGHERDWHQDGTVFESISREGPLENILYKNINKSDVCWNLVLFENIQLHRHILGKGNRFTYPVFQNRNEFEIYRYLLGDNLPPYIFSKACAQFIVHRDMIRTRPKVFWMSLLDRMYEVAKNYPDDRKKVAYYFEYTFFFVMTQCNDEYIWNLKSGSELRQLLGLTSA